MSDILQSVIILLGRALFVSMPFLVTALAMMVSMIPLNIFGGWLPAPELGIIAAFFWAVYAPQLFPPPAIFALGMVQDFCSGGPFGFWATIYLAVYGFTLSQRVFFMGRSIFGGVWLGFAAVSALAAVAIWLLASTAYNRWVPPGEIFLQLAVTAAVFPAIAPAFIFLRRAMTTAPERF